MAVTRHAAALPPGLVSRRPSVDDAAAILPVVTACDVRVLGRSDVTLGEVAADLGGPGVDNARGGQLVESPAGEVVGWLWTEARESASSVFVDAYSLDQAVMRWLLERALDYLDLVAAEWGRPLLAAAGCYQHDDAYAAALTAAGFGVVRSFWRMKRSLDGVAAEPPPLPPGLSIRVVDGADEAERRLLHRLNEEAFSDHWHYRPLPFEEWDEVLQAAAGRNPEQWWVAEVEGVPAGLLIGTDIRAELGEAHVDTLGVLSAYRGRGVGRALLSVAFADAVRRGRSHVGLGVDSESPTGATRLYESVGMSVDRVLLAWELEVSP